LVTKLNQTKNPPKQIMNVSMAEEAVNILLTTENPTNIKNDRPPKHPVMSSVCLKDMAVEGWGLKNEKGHQIKSLSASQL